MVLAIEYFAAAGNTVAAGVFIPVANLPGVQAAELDGSVAAEGKVTLSLLNALSGYLTSHPEVIGIGATQNAPTSNGANLLTLNFTAFWDKLADLEASTIGLIPVPGSGANAGVGDMAITDVFAGAAALAGAAATAGAGVLIPNAAVAAYGAAAPTVGAGNDNRAWFSGLLDHLTECRVRETGVTTSAVTTAALGVVAADVIPADYYAAADPTTGLVEADLPHLGILTRTSTYSVQVLLNQTTQQFDVRVA